MSKNNPLSTLELKQNIINEVFDASKTAKNNGCSNVKKIAIYPIVIFDTNFKEEFPFEQDYFSNHPMLMPFDTVNYSDLFLDCAYNIEKINFHATALEVKKQIQNIRNKAFSYDVACKYYGASGDADDALSYAERITKKTDKVFFNAIKDTKRFSVYIMDPIKFYSNSTLDKNVLLNENVYEVICIGITKNDLEKLIKNNINK